MPMSAEDRIRSGLPLVRFLQSVAPPAAAQSLLRRAVAKARLPEGFRREAAVADGVACEWIVPPNASSRKALIYLHGGGFVFGQTPSHMKLGAFLAGRMGVRALMVDYRLAPEHPYPAALDDCVAAYRWALRQGFEAEGLVLAGDSAGGNLAIAAMMRLRDEGERAPAAAACLSPVVSLVPGSNVLAGMEDPILPPKAIAYYNASYIGAGDPANPLISPLLGDLRGLPPLLIHVGEQEILRDNAIKFAGLAKEAGVEASCEVFARMWHVWQLFPQLPEARRSLELIADFLADRLRRERG